MTNEHAARGSVQRSRVATEESGAGTRTNMDALNSGVGRESIDTPANPAADGLVRPKANAYTRGKRHAFPGSAQQARAPTLAKHSHAQQHDRHAPPAGPTLTVKSALEHFGVPKTRPL
jgi:hypothetical protein